MPDGKGTGVRWDSPGRALCFGAHLAGLGRREAIGPEESRRALMPPNLQAQKTQFRSDCRTLACAKISCGPNVGV